MSLTEAEAVQIQNELRNFVVSHDELADPVRIVAGVDVCYDEDRNLACASIALMDAAARQVVESELLVEEIEFPYIPRLFSFREVPPLIKLLAKIKNKPDIIICDGHGLAHPRRFGLACHLGVLTGYPAIGCGKSRLTGTYDEPGGNRGDRSFLFDEGEVIGAVLRTQTNVRPLFVSIGHKVSLATSCRIVLEQADSYRIPEVIRVADRMGRRKIREMSIR